MIAVVSRRNSSSVILDDGTADRKPHAGALGLGREERLEHSLQSLGRNASPPILNADENFPRLGGRRTDGHAAVGRQARIERFEGISQ